MLDKEGNKIVLIKQIMIFKKSGVKKWKEKIEEILQPNY